MVFALKIQIRAKQVLKSYTHEQRLNNHSALVVILTLLKSNENNTTVDINKRMDGPTGCYVIAISNPR